jgi:hypothetical protein
MSMLVLLAGHGSLRKMDGSEQIMETFEEERGEE